MKQESDPLCLPLLHSHPWMVLLAKTSAHFIFSPSTTSFHTEFSVFLKPHISTKQSGKALSCVE